MGFVVSGLGDGHSLAGTLLNCSGLCGRLVLEAEVALMYF